MVRSSKLVLNFHGLGPRPDWVGSAEAHFWCDDVSFFHALLDTIEPATRATGVPIEITFDDGNLSDLTIALPALVERGLTASFFVCAGRIGTTGYLDGAGILELRAAGMHVGSHGWSHIDWRTADDATLRREVDDARDTIEQLLGENIQTVAIPFGSYDRRVFNKLHRFSTVYTSDGGLAPVGRRIMAREAFEADWHGDVVRELTGRRDPISSVPRRAWLLYKRLR